LRMGLERDEPGRRHPVLISAFHCHLSVAEALRKIPGRLLAAGPHGVPTVRVRIDRRMLILSMYQGWVERKDAAIRRLDNPVGPDFVRSADRESAADVNTILRFVCAHQQDIAWRMPSERVLVVLCARQIQRWARTTGGVSGLAGSIGHGWRDGWRKGARFLCGTMDVYSGLKNA